MRLVLQRVSEASVAIDGERTGSIGLGLVVFLCVEKGDSRADADRYVAKIASLRIFDDAAGKMNRSLEQVSGEVLLISQFTLAADAEKGRRPSFDRAAPPEVALPLYEYFLEKMRGTGLRIVSGVFQARMKIALVNEGPVTILLGNL
jgi:D-tyrosyl-tRNA(Tyr) deacylase